jgi:hypothetical protein
MKGNSVISLELPKGMGVNFFPKVTVEHGASVFHVVLGIDRSIEQGPSSSKFRRGWQLVHEGGVNVPY